MTAADRLTEIQARADAATEGPWRLEQINHREFFVGFKGGDTTIMERPDASFIANAREDIPWLLAELARLQTELTTANERIEAVRGNVYLYRIEHLTPETTIAGIESALALSAESAGQETGT